MSGTLILIVGWALIIGACVFAWWKGGPAERWGGVVNLAVSILGLPIYLLPVGSRQTSLLMVDGLLAFGLLLLAVRYTSLWIGTAMLLQAVQFMLHTYYFVMELRHDALFAIVNNMVLVGIVLCIVGGTMLSWAKRAQGNRPATV
jgi:hypothetical protein